MSNRTSYPKKDDFVLFIESHARMLKRKQKELKADDISHVIWEIGKYMQFFLDEQEA